MFPEHQRVNLNRSTRVLGIPVQTRRRQALRRVKVDQPLNVLIDNLESRLVQQYSPGHREMKPHVVPVIREQEAIAIEAQEVPDIKS